MMCDFVMCMRRNLRTLEFMLLFIYLFIYLLFVKPLYNLALKKQY